MKFTETTQHENIQRWNQGLPAWEMVLRSASMRLTILQDGSRFIVALHWHNEERGWLVPYWWYVKGWEEAEELTYGVAELLRPFKPGYKGPKLIPQRLREMAGKGTPVSREMIRGLLTDSPSR